MDRTQLPQDPISGNVHIIEPEHGAIHAGSHYTVSVLTTTSSYLTLVYTTPSAGTNIRAHFIFAANTDNAGVMTFSKDAVVSGGTSLVVHNNNQRSTHNNAGIWLVDPVVTTAGTVLERHLIGVASQGPVSPGGRAGSRNEWRGCS